MRQRAKFGNVRLRNSGQRHDYDMEARMGWLALLAAGVFVAALFYGFSIGRMRTVDPLSIGGYRNENPKMFWVATAINLAWVVILIIAAVQLGL